MPPGRFQIGVMCRASPGWSCLALPGHRCQQGGDLVNPALVFILHRWDSGRFYQPGQLCQAGVQLRLFHGAVVQGFAAEPGGGLSDSLLNVDLLFHSSRVARPPQRPRLGKLGSWPGSLLAWFCRRGWLHLAKGLVALRRRDVPGLFFGRVLPALLPGQLVDLFLSKFDLFHVVPVLVSGSTRHRTGCLALLPAQAGGIIPASLPVGLEPEINRAMVGVAPVPIEQLLRPQA